MDAVQVARVWRGAGRDGVPGLDAEQVARFGAEPAVVARPSVC